MFVLVHRGSEQGDFVFYFVTGLLWRKSCVFVHMCMCDYLLKMRSQTLLRMQYWSKQVWILLLWSAQSKTQVLCMFPTRVRRSGDGMEVGAGVVVLTGVDSHSPFFQYWNKLQWTWFGAWFSRDCFNTERIKSEPLLSDEPWHSGPAPGLVLAWTLKVGCSQWFLNLSMTFFLKLHTPWVLHLRMD